MLSSHNFILLYRTSTLFLILSIKNSIIKSFHSNCKKSIVQRIALKKSQENTILSKEIWFHIYYTFLIIFTLSVLVFKQRWLRMGFTFVKIQPRKMLLQVRKCQFNQKRMNIHSKKVDPCCFVIKTMVSGKLETVSYM